MRAAAVWLGAFAIAFVPTAIAALSPLNAGRDAVWIVGGLAGVVALALLFLQPLLVAGFMPRLGGLDKRFWHRGIGLAVVVMVALHVVGLYLTSPEDITDALLLVSPTPFAIYGVVGLVGVALTVLLAGWRRHLGRRLGQGLHVALAAVVVTASVVHSWLIDGAMGETSKFVLCLFALGAAFLLILKTSLTALRRSP